MDYVITFSDVMAGLMSIGLGVITFFVKKWFDKMEKKDDVLQSAIENTTSTLNKKIEQGNKEIQEKMQLVLTEYQMRSRSCRLEKYIPRTDVSCY